MLNHQTTHPKHCACVVILLTFVLSAFGQNATNPFIWADVPDPSMIRVGDTYYMTSTTMHMSPGVPIMKSTNLVNWTTVNYAYDRLIENDKMNLNNGQEAYGNGSWASSIQYKEGTYYIHTFSYTSGKSHIYKTTDIENGPFSAYTLSSLTHDASLLLDDDGRNYLVYGHDEIHLLELNSEATAIKSGGVSTVIISSASSVAGSNMILTAEGTQMFKINGYYYVMNICWPSGGGRTVVIHRSKNLTGPYEGRVALNDQGIAQGGLISTPEGKWYAYLFQDHGSVGRIPYLVPVTWSNDWPVFGENGKVPTTLSIPLERSDLRGIIASDDFESMQNKNNGLKLEWQWNHNPVNEYWSLTDHEGFLRLTNDRVDADFVSTHNTLTQRSIGPESVGSIALEVQNMKDGDYAGLGALQYDYGFVGVKMNGNSKSIVMVNGTSSKPVEVESVPLSQERVYFRIKMDFNNKTDKAYFYYSLDGNTWQSIGNTLQMSYSLEHFMGYRFALFNFGTKSAGGYVDFDHYIINDYPFENTPAKPQPVPGKIEAESYLLMSGIQNETDSTGNFNIGWINDGDWTKYLLDVSQKSLYALKVSVATGADVNNTITVKDKAGNKLGTLTVDSDRSDGWHDWYVDSVIIELDSGEQELRLEYNGESEYLFNIDWFELSTTTATPIVQAQNLAKGYSFLNAGEQLFLQAPVGEQVRLEIYSITGQKVFDQQLSISNASPLAIDLKNTHLQSGLYYAVLKNGPKNVLVKSLAKTNGFSAR